MKLACSNARKIKADIEIMALSCKSGDGLDTWIEWFESHAREKNSRSQSGTNL